jgi:hypothetical protein
LWQVTIEMKVTCPNCHEAVETAGAEPSRVLLEVCRSVRGLSAAEAESLARGDELSPEAQAVVEKWVARTRPKVMGRPRTVAHIEGYAQCQCAECRAAKRARRAQHPPVAVRTGSRRRKTPRNQIAPQIASTGFQPSTHP